MQMKTRTFKVNPLVASLAIAFSLSHSVASAQSTFAADGAFNVGQDKANSAANSAQAGSFTIAPAAGPSTASAVGNTAGYYSTLPSIAASSLGDGHFGGSVRAWEFYSAHAPMQTNLKLVFADSIVNTTGATQSASFALGISSLQFVFDYGDRMGFNRMSFSAKVYADGTSAPLWSSAFSYENGMVAYDSTSPGSFTTSGADIGLAAAFPSNCTGFPGSNFPCAYGSAEFGISNYQTTVSLGSVAASSSIGIRYEIELSTETDMYGGTAAISFNDPSNLSLNGPTNGRLAFDVAVVPEPETALLMAAGLGVLALGRRRRAR